MNTYKQYSDAMSTICSEINVLSAMAYNLENVGQNGLADKLHYIVDNIREGVDQADRSFDKQISIEVERAEQSTANMMNTVMAGFNLKENSE
jgi:hypothetical protein|tara:strand:+ start:3840 stop:4115 length:276 start_codon:yes stop_codon:yes gene_type:complete